MPLTPAELVAALEAAAASPASVSGDQGSATARSADDLLKLYAAAAAAALVQSTPPRTPFAFVGFARFKPPGAV